MCGMACIMEALLIRQMNVFAEETGILHSGVHGYREGMSTVKSLIEIQIRLITAVEEKKISSSCLLVGWIQLQTLICSENWRFMDTKKKVFSG